MSKDTPSKAIPTGTVAENVFQVFFKVVVGILTIVFLLVCVPFTIYEKLKERKASDETRKKFGGNSVH